MYTAKWDVVKRTTKKSVFIVEVCFIISSMYIGVLIITLSSRFFFVMPSLSQDLFCFTIFAFVSWNVLKDDQLLFMECRTYCFVDLAFKYWAFLKNVYVYKN